MTLTDLIDRVRERQESEFAMLADEWRKYREIAIEEIMQSLAKQRALDLWADDGGAL